MVSFVMYLYCHRLVLKACRPFMTFPFKKKKRQDTEEDRRRRSSIY
jgi:hypothetical protein